MPTSVHDACAIFSRIAPDPGFETRWTRNEKQQVATFDLVLADACGQR